MTAEHPPAEHFAWLEERGFLPEETADGLRWRRKGPKAPNYRILQTEKGWCWVLEHTTNHTWDWTGLPGRHPRSVPFQYTTNLFGEVGNVDFELYRMTWEPSPEKHAAWLRAQGFQIVESPYPEYGFSADVWEHPAFPYGYVAYAPSHNRDTHGWGAVQSYRLGSEVPSYRMGVSHSRDWCPFIYPTPKAALQAWERSRRTHIDKIRREFDKKVLDLANKRDKDIAFQEARILEVKATLGTLK